MHKASSLHSQHSGPRLHLNKTNGERMRHRDDKTPGPQRRGINSAGEHHGSLLRHRGLPAPKEPYMCVLSGNSKRLHHARTLTRPRLYEVADRLYLFSFLLPVDSLMLGHWLQHYHGLGVWPNHTHLAVRMDPGRDQEDRLRATMSVLRRAGVPRGNVRVVSSPPSDDLKISMTNEVMQSVPKDSWFIYADADELFDYPCNLSPSRLNRHRCMLGAMVDQVAENGNITEARESPSLHEQFPRQCRVRMMLVPHLQQYKVIITTVGGDLFETRRFRTTHAINSSKCVALGAVRHYSMTGQQLENNAERSTIQPTKPKPEQLKKGIVVNYANATCGHPNPVTGACMDYAMMHQWMVRQVQRVAANGSAPTSVHMCPRNLTYELWSAPTYEAQLAQSAFVAPDDRVALERAVSAKLMPAATLKDVTSRSALGPKAAVGLFEAQMKRAARVASSVANPSS